MMTATLALAAITLALVIVAVALVATTRARTARALADARKELDLVRHLLGAEHRPLLVDVLSSAPVPRDMDTRASAFPGLEPRPFDPRTVFVAFEAEKIYVSVPLRNVGRGLAVVDGGGVALAGPLVGNVEYRTVQREHVPVEETTRIDLIAIYLTEQGSDPSEQGSTMRGIAWQLTVPYSDFAGQQRALARLQIVCRGGDITGPWLVDRVEQEAMRGPMVRSDDLPDQSLSEVTAARPQRAGVRGESVVDLWGNPVRPRRRDR